MTYKTTNGLKNVTFIDFKTGESKEGLFHGFSQAYEEFSTGPGNYTVAIIELGDGSIKEVTTEKVTFIKEDAKKELDGEKLLELLRNLVAFGPGKYIEYEGSDHDWDNDQEYSFRQASEYIDEIDKKNSD